MVTVVRNAALLASLGAISSIAVACGGSKPADAPPRSPSSDYPAPAQETSQGEVVGADRVPPGDKLKTGPTIGPGGVTPASGPGTTEPSSKKSQNPK